MIKSRLKEVGGGDKKTHWLIDLAINDMRVTTKYIISFLCHPANRQPRS